MDYFTIKQQFYTGNYEEVLNEIAKFNKTEDETLDYYRNRALIALSQFGEGSDSSSLNAVFQTYYKFLNDKQNEQGVQALEKAVDKAGRSPFALNLLVVALAIAGELERALEVAVEGIDSDSVVGTPELLLTAIQVTLLNNQASVATTMFENFQALQEQTNDDEIILNLAESYINFNQGKGINGSNFYFFEELAQTFPSWKTQLGLLNLHLQQSNLPEAQAVIEVLESEFYQVKPAASSYKPDLLANKITYHILSGDDVSQLRSELQALKPSHPLCVNYKQNNLTFDQIVQRYAA